MKLLLRSVKIMKEDMTNFVKNSKSKIVNPIKPFCNNNVWNIFFDKRISINRCLFHFFHDTKSNPVFGKNTSDDCDSILVLMKSIHQFFH